MKILVGGKVSELSIIDSNTGCEWTQDLIGNQDGFDGYSEEAELHEMTAETFVWWEKYIKTEQNLQDSIASIRNELNDNARDKFDSALINASDNDIEHDQLCKMQFMSAWIDEETNSKA